MLKPGTIIAVEGITGIGKSNLGQQLALSLAESDVDVRWYFELEQANPVIPRYHDHRIIESSIDRWKEFLDSPDHKNRVSVIDGRLFLINIVWSLTHGLSSEEIELKLVPLVRLVERKGVEIVYLRTGDLESIFSNTFQKRNGEDWYIETCESSAYCKARGLSGRTAVVEFYREVDRIMAKVLGGISGRVQVADIGNGGWDSAYRQVFAYFGLTQAAQKSTNGAESELFAGTYTGSFNGTPSRFKVEYSHDELVLVEHPFTIYKPVEELWKLIALGENTYLARGQPVKLQFIRNTLDRVSGLYLLGMYDPIVKNELDMETEKLFAKSEA